MRLAPAYGPVLGVIDPSSISLGTVLAANPPGSLVGFRAGVIVLLVPGEVPSAAALHQTLGSGPLVWGRTAAPGPALRSEVECAERVLAIARARGETGVFGPQDLLLGQVLAGDARVAQLLEELVLKPLRQHDRSGRLLSTLRAYLATGSVQAAATSEGVHSNTVGYRLHRVAEVTGFDFRVPTDATVLVLAVESAPGPSLEAIGRSHKN
ncbi:MAG: PucR family transcriptional regulator [Acidimicrobiales bacterium]